MSAMVKLAKEIDESYDIGQPTAECHLMAWPYERRRVTRRDELRPRRWSKRHQGACLGVEDAVFQEKDGYMDEPRSVKDGAEDTDERVMTSHTEGCDATSVEEGHDVERVTAQIDETVGSLKQLKGETSADLTALEKGLDRKTNHQGLTKDRDTAKVGEAATLERQVAKQRRVNVVACILVLGARGHSPRRGEEIPPLFEHCHQFFVGGSQREGPFARQVHGRERYAGLGRRWSRDPQFDDHSEQQDRECTNLDRPCHQRDCVSAFTLRH